MIGKEKQLDLIVFSLGVLLLFFWYSDLLLHLNEAYFSFSGDGLKNYYTPIYQMKYGVEFWKFEGMNYPYGEHLVFTDAQPTTVGLVNLLSLIFPSISNYSLGILNGFMLVSIPLGAVFIQRIFQQYKVQTIVSIPFALAIAFFSPQLYRFYGHYALSYVFVIPMFYYYLLKHMEEASWIRSSFIGFGLILCAFLHLYYLLIIAFFFSAVYLVQSIKTKKIKKHISHWFVQVIIPFALVMLLLKITDPILDRPYSPYGFMAYRALWEGYTFALGSPLINWIEEHVVNIRHVGFEAQLYLGFFTVTSALFYIGLTIKRKFKWIKAPHNDHGILLGSILLALFSLGVPFVYGLEYLIDYLGPLQQFRSIARFSWPFYYVLNVSIVIWLFNYRNDIINSKVRSILLALVAIVFFAEVHIRNKKVSKTITNIEHSFNYNDITPQSYQAILPIPFYHIGSECLKKDSPEGLQRRSMQTSLKTGIPIFSHMGSRSSFKQSISYFRYFYSGFLEAELLHPSSKKPFLLIKDKKASLLPIEKILVSKAEFLREDTDFEYYELENLTISHKEQKEIQRVYHGAKDTALVKDQIMNNSDLIDLPLEGQQVFDLIIETATSLNQGQMGSFFLHYYAREKKYKLKLSKNLDYISGDRFIYKSRIDLHFPIDSAQFGVKLNSDFESIKVLEIGLKRG